METFEEKVARVVQENVSVVSCTKQGVRLSLFPEAKKQNLSQHISMQRLFIFPPAQLLKMPPWLLSSPCLFCG